MTKDINDIVNTSLEELQQTREYLRKQLANVKHSILLDSNISVNELVKKEKCLRKELLDINYQISLKTLRCSS